MPLNERRAARTAMLLLLLLLTLPAVVQAQFNYTITNGTVTITGYTGPDGAVTIPSTINGLPVTSIGACAFYLCYWLTSITLPNSVTSIGDQAFCCCALLASVTIGTNVTSIGDWAFGWSGLTSVTIPNSVTNIGDYAFYCCTSLTNVTLGNGVTSIGGGAFRECASLTSITIPNTVTNIGDSAFAWCTNLTSVTIGTSVTTIGDGAFRGCSSLTAITVDTHNSVYSDLHGVLFNQSLTTIVEYPGGIAGSYTIPTSVTSIRQGAFAGCTRLTSVTIPNSVTNIGDSAFAWCTNLTSVTIPSSVTNIGYGAFGGCSSLTAITVDTHNSVYSDLDGVLFNQSLTTIVEYPGGIAGSYTIPNSVTSIGIEAFWDCTSLTTVTIGNGVTNVGGEAFYNCTNLTSVTIGTNVTSIGDGAFAYCLSLTSVYFQGNAPSFGADVFCHWRGLIGSGPVYDPATIYYLPGTTGWGLTPAITGRPVVLWTPQVLTSDASFGVRTNQFGFAINWASGMTVVVEACTNLANPTWYPLTTNTLTSGSAYFSDSQWTNYPARFYRLLWQ